MHQLGASLSLFSCSRRTYSYISIMGLVVLPLVSYGTGGSTTCIMDLFTSSKLYFKYTQKLWNKMHLNVTILMVVNLKNAINYFIQLMTTSRIVSHLFILFLIIHNQIVSYALHFKYLTRTNFGYNSNQHCLTR